MMNDNISLEDRLQSLGAALRSRPGLTLRVMDQVRKSAADGSTPGFPTYTANFTTRRHRRHLTASAGIAAMIGVAILIASTLFPSRSIGWADVAKAIQSQKWIRGTVTYVNGKRGTMWLAPDRQIWAFIVDRSFYFNDGQEKAKYEYHNFDQAITKLPLGEDNSQRVLPIEALSQNQSEIGPWLMGTERIIKQKRREVTEDGKLWIEFQMVTSRGEMNQATLRVDPETKLPVRLRITSATDMTKSSEWMFDYPMEGPADIYALGVPQEVKIDDRMPSDNVRRVLDAMAASRASIGNFRLIVFSGREGSIVYRKGNRWRVDSWQRLVDVATMRKSPQDWDQWLEQQLQLSVPTPLFVCDGNSVWENSSHGPGEKPRWNLSKSPAPQDLMSGEGLGALNRARLAKFASLVFPDLSPKPGWGFEFDSNPANFPGCVLLKRSMRVTQPEGAIGHEWYYVDPTKGCAVVRAELFTMPTDAPGKPEASQTRQTLRMEEFRQSPQGFWYPAVVYDKTPATIISPTIINNQLSKVPTMGHANFTVRYRFDFDAELPDSLFTVGNVRSPEK